MNYLKSLIIIALGVTCFSCNIAFMNTEKVKGNGNLVTKSYTLESYEEIKIVGSADAKLVQGTEGNVKVSIDENLLEYFEVYSQSGVLRVGTKEGYNLRPTSKIIVEIPVEEISKLSIAGSGDINSTTSIVTKDVKISIAGSGNINVPFEANSIKASIAGSGDIYLKGNTDKLDVSIAGSGSFIGTDLVAKDARIRIAGSGNVNVDAREYLKVRINGSGDVRYKGAPKQTDLKANGSGSIRSL